MDLKEFQTTLAEAKPPAGVSVPVLALWHEARGNWAASEWERAHEILQDCSGSDAAWVHAYLHRREGDIPNARYWYSRAERAPQDGSLEQEWADIALALLS